MGYIWYLFCSAVEPVEVAMKPKRLTAKVRNDGECHVYERRISCPRLTMPRTR
jgi:hypothetical protein